MVGQRWRDISADHLIKTEQGRGHTVALARSIHGNITGLGPIQTGNELRLYVCIYICECIRVVSIIDAVKVKF